MWRKAEKELQKDKYMAPLIKKWGSCTIKPRIHINYFQALIGEIIGQQLSGRVADVIEARLKSKVKGRLTPDKILNLAESELRNCGMAWSKVRAVKDLALKTKNGELKVKILDKLENNEVIEQLVQVKGIGRWTAEMFLMFSLARPDILPKDDLGISKALKNLKIKERDTEKWKPYRTVASWYLWRSLENR
ncbi:MAG: DNA-3-methyladenine glycosylase 2 family protein [Patescibacteria group bacterium]